MAIWNIIRNIIEEDIIQKLTKGFRSELVACVKKLDKKAKSTKNPYDDMLVKIIKSVLVIKD